ncbi:MAG: hypothetical protein ACXVHB_17360 [Solirubrobacteraceae bacterium]
MFARVSTFTGGLQDLDQGIAVARERTVPRLEKHHGFEGSLLMVDRAAGSAFAITLWRSEEDLAASQEDDRQLTERAAHAFDVQVQVNNYEVAFSTLG